ncbi:C40 family peptidase [Sporomusa sphaeroides DSM 2875]|uniref:C40 family peptidase n=1 Tax=Sporomusa sphaeroides TaxID=47679 RepID=UPI002030D186|nr:NlpC/P60 family protein [Sporomusa sphaeroides]MCM0760660.1 C40 family peptidase [Sporomusa sphaeroides DSM 2875]
MFEDLLGLPFVDGGRGPDKYDCWGLACEVYRRHGIELPDYRISAYDTRKIGQQITNSLPDYIEVKYPLPVPCLMAIRVNGSYASHVGVYVGNGQFIHAYQPTGVVIDRIKRWQSSIVGFYVPGG